MRVDVSGNSFHFPSACACCGGVDRLTLLPVAFTKTSGKKVVHTSSTAWDIPYCTPCAEHIAQSDQARTVTTIATAVTIVVAVVSLLLAVWFAFLVLAGGFAIVFAVSSRLRESAKSLCSSQCVGPERAVSYLYWHGTHHAFNMLSQRYALLFMGANAKKLINLDPQTAQWLVSNGVPLAPPGQQAPRKFRT